ncbi:MAG: hypothetical protein KBG48_11365 [Kofleriaceae bacterium]|nr:hypothetical protein [Kofleriaceae bacterium]MBP9167983.1 hypothetical protein [Kofleriaceae bacterium]MBP9856817.1 hypothetical protein [Kofleriaceae bacterium]
MTITLTWRDDSRRRLDGMQVAVAGSAQDRTPANGARFRELVKCVLSPDLAPERVRDRLLSLLDRSKPPATETARVDRFQLGLVDTHPRTPGFTLMVSVMGPRS